jgi:hypothetical protein
LDTRTSYFMNTLLYGFSMLTIYSSATYYQEAITSTIQQI